MAKQQDILESNEAEIVLNYEVFKKSIRQLHEEYVQMWISSDAEDEKLREQMHMAVKLLPEVEKHLRIIIEKGKITKANLSRIRKIV
mgnify:FL=1